MKISKFLLQLMILLGSFYMSAQETDNAESLIVNEWSLRSFELNGQTFPPKENNKNDRMVFYADKRVESISSGEALKGTWSYDKDSHMLKVVEQQKRFEMQLKLISIKSGECVLELENPKDTFIRLNMVSVAK